MRRPDTNRAVTLEESRAALASHVCRLGRHGSSCWHDAFVGREPVDRDARLGDNLADSGAVRPGTVGDLRRRLTALSDWHPSSPQYRLESRSPESESGSSRTSPDVRADHEALGNSGARESLNGQDSDHPSPADIQLTAERRAHILYGDRTGGGHRHGVGSPGKTEFPAHWDDSKITENVLSVARSPDKQPTRQNWNDRWRVQGNRDGVDIVAIVSPDGLVWTAWPRQGSPGVVKNKHEDR
jgi:Bacterial EndoU nuclease